MTENLFPSILLFGTPGVGKGTQGKMLGGMNGLHHLSSGDIFRSLEPESAEGQEVKRYSSRGGLVPDELTIRIWRNWMDRLIAAGQYDPQTELLLLDGIPRNVAQCEILEKHIEIRKVVHMTSPDDDPIIERIKNRALAEGRDDDAKEDVIRRRFQVYRDKTAPILNYYPSSIVAEIDAMGTQSEVQKRILEQVIPVLRDFAGGDDAVATPQHA